MKAFADGDSVCVTTDHFVNLQESPAVFLPADSEEGRLALSDSPYALSPGRMTALYEELAAQLRSRDCPNWGRRSTWHYGPCGECDACEVSEWLT